MFVASPKIFYLLVNLLLIIKSFLNSILTLVLSRISLLGKLCCGDNLRIVYMSSPWGTIASLLLPRLFRWECFFLHLAWAPRPSLHQSCLQCFILAPASFIHWPYRYPLSVSLVSKKKSHRLPFLPSSTVATAPLKLIHFDLWGPSHVSVVSSHRYYISFVNHYRSMFGFIL